MADYICMCVYMYMEGVMIHFQLVGCFQFVFYFFYVSLLWIYTLICMHIGICMCRCVFECGLDNV